MNLKLIKFLAAVSAGLLFVIFCEWMYSTYAQKQLVAEIKAGGQQKHASAELPSIELDERPEGSYVDLVNRPLFIQGRKPVNEPDSATAQVTNTSTETFNWSLNGIYTYQNNLYALFSRTTGKVPKDNYRKVTKDNDIDGWKLVEIHKDKVVVSQGSKREVIPLRKTKPKVLASAVKNPMAPAPPQVPIVPMPQLPNQPPLIPGQQPIPIPEPVEEPELIPDEDSESNFENSADEELQ